MNFGRKFKAMRIAEGLKQAEFAEITEIPIGTIQNYENGKRTVNEVNLKKVTKHEMFKKYAYWLTTDETLPESGQIAPDFSILLECGIVNAEDDAAKRA